MTVLKELAVANGTVLIEKIPMLLLDEALRLSQHQQRGKLLSNFGN
jgi:hypothetical protein